ncbi:hypothetical protein GPROT1_02256 [Gammaproteobacteria bacterium]|nr:hypothetical protein GPROT1_02256 [Gammaproteobacteria bacterium]
MIEFTLKVKITAAQLAKILQVLVVLWLSVKPLT